MLSIDEHIPFLLGCGGSVWSAWYEVASALSLPFSRHVGITVWCELHYFGCESGCNVALSCNVILNPAGIFLLTKLLMGWTIWGVIRRTVRSCEISFPGDPYPHHIIRYYHWANGEDLCKHVPVAEVAEQLKSFHLSAGVERRDFPSQYKWIWTPRGVEAASVIVLILACLWSSLM